jgi:hypothetical protein
LADDHDIRLLCHSMLAKLTLSPAAVAVRVGVVV